MVTKTPVEMCLTATIELLSTSGCAMEIEALAKVFYEMMYLAQKPFMIGQHFVN